MSISSLTSPPLAKAALYYYSKSIWSAVVLLALEEKGYGQDEVDRKQVDINAGESYTTSYLRINPKGTVPCLIVPLDKTLGADVENRYKALTESTTVCEFLDKSRSATSKTNTTSEAPAPTLSPATITLSDKSNAIIQLVHSADTAPIKFVVGCRNLSELRAKASGPPGEVVNGRYKALQKQLAEAESGVNPKYREFWERRSAVFKPYVDVFTDAEKEESELSAEGKKLREELFANSDALWTGEVKRVMATLEKEIVGPLSLGDQISLADLHLAAYLTRLVKLSGGDGSASGVLGIGRQGSVEWEVGSKVKEYWTTMIGRRSWKVVYGEGVY